MNVCVFNGKLVKDPELKNTPNGSEYCKFTLAVNEKRKQGEEWKEHTEYINCMVWGKRAGVINQYCSQGSGLIVRGKMNTTSFDKNGEKKYFTNINVEDFNFTTSAKKKEDKPQNKPEAQQEFAGEDIPF